MTIIKKLSFTLTLVAWLMICSGPALACSVPVFRYALERWDASPYALVVFHRGPLPAADKKLIDIVNKTSVEVGGKTNIFVKTVDVSKEMDHFVASLWAQENDPKLPLSVLRYPAKDTAMGMPGPVVWRGQLTKKTIGLMLDSPARKEIVKRITGGDSAVWVYLGDKKQIKNTAAFEATLKKVQGQVKMSEPDPADDEWGPGGTPIKDMQKNLKLNFSVVRVDRDDPKEKMFVMALLGSEPNLEVKAAGKPMVFAIFGRGRALPPIVGKGMTEDNIGKACAFLVGPCSCTIKRLNPGTDMLMTADWIIGVKEPLVKDVQIPSLPGLSEKVSPENVVPAPAPGGATKPAPKTDKPSTDKPKKKDGAAKPAVVPDAATEPAPKKDEPQKDGAAAPVSSSAAAAV